ncbi:hypothetical protein [Paractinoplanes globisporus]|jgi:hypothetical protein|uniref:Lipoprotein n=1 Tax=Paractinoplanes globisporus TaxID=113565 RepID=A0ABW6WU91_9ACTN|nr:hypothetical protein [Actinoplanes globisporus]
MTYAGRAALAAMLVVLAGGCAQPSVSSDPSPPVFSSPAASHPPNGFTDNNKPTGWIVGTVTAGGTGPCYGLETDDGVLYALHSTAGLRLDRGSRIKIKGTPARVRIDCGPGQLLEMTAAEPLR